MKIGKTYNFSTHGDHRGTLVAVDKYSGLPFELRRIYYIFGTEKTSSRGHHAHKELHQLAICLSGSCTMVLDNGFERESILIDSPHVGIDLPPMLWHEMHDFSDDCILLVLASDYFNEGDYIRDYQEFKNFINI